MRAKMMRKALTQIALVVAITALAFVGLEVLVATFWPQVPSTTTADGGPIGMADSVLGYRYRQNVRALHRTPEFEVEYVINADGLRDAGETPTAPPNRLTRILLLGDSFTFGQGTDYDKIWPTLFERALWAQGYEVDVVNAGIQGYSTRDEVLFLEQILPQVDPDIVVLVFLANDLYANVPAEEAPPERTSVQTPQRRGVRRVHGAGGLQTVMLAQRFLAANDWFYLRLYALTPWIGYFRIPPTPAFDAKIAITKDLLRKAEALSEASGATLVVLSVPQQFQVLASAYGFRSTELDVRLADSTLASFAEAEGLIWISTLDGLANRYRTRSRNLFFRFDGHLNEHGNQVLATAFTSAFLGHFAADLHRSPTLQRAHRAVADERGVRGLEP